MIKSGNFPDFKLIKSNKPFKNKYKYGIIYQYGFKLYFNIM